MSASPPAGRSPPEIPLRTPSASAGSEPSTPGKGGVTMNVPQDSQPATPAAGNKAEKETTNDAGKAGEFGSDKLPACVQRIIDVVFKPCFREDESFDEYLRKAAMLCFAMITMISPIWGALIVVSAFDDSGFIVSRIGNICVAVYVFLHQTVFNYIYIRRTRSCPRWFASLASWGTTVTCAILSVTAVEVDTRMLLMMSFLLTSIMNVPNLWLHAIADSSILIFQYLRDNLGEMTGLVFPWDSEKRTDMEVLLMLIVYSMIPFASGAGTLYLIVTSYIKKSEQSRRARMMTVEVADLLSRYDTDGVLKTLDSNRGEVDDNLIVSFEHICQNLQSFKPHIPYYLIQEAIDRANTAEGGSDEKALEDADKDSLHSDEGSISLYAQSISDMGGTSNSVRVESLDNSSSKSPAIGNLMAPPTKSAPKQAVPDAGFRGKVSSCYVDFGAKTVIDAIPILSDVVELINEIGADTKTSLHYMSGDSMFASWNATSRVGNQELRACMFATRVYATLKKHTGLQPSCSVVTCVASALFAGKSQAHFTLLSDDLARHNSQRAIAKKYQAVVGDSRVARSVETRFLLAGFAKAEDGEIIYDVVGEKGPTAEDEWMYQLEEAEGKDPYVQVTAALRHHMKQEDMEAEQILRKLPSHVLSRLTVKSLHTKIIGSSPN